MCNANIKIPCNCMEVNEGKCKVHQMGWFKIAMKPIQRFEVSPFLSSHPASSIGAEDTISEQPLSSPFVKLFLVIVKLGKIWKSLKHELKIMPDVAAYLYNLPVNLATIWKNHIALDFNIIFLGVRSTTNLNRPSIFLMLRLA